MGAEKEIRLFGGGNLIQLSVVPNEAGGDILEIGLPHSRFAIVCVSLNNKITDRLAAAEGLFLLTAKETKLPAR